MAADPDARDAAAAGTADRPRPRARYPRALAIEHASLLRRLDVLETSGLIERICDVRDRRSNQVIVTPAGAHLHRQVFEACEAVGARLLAAISAQEQALCQGVFDRIERAPSLAPGKPAGPS